MYPLPTFDAQAHRGGRGHWTEESATAFKNALDVGVTTLELDIVLTKDLVPAVWHDPVILEEKCSSRIGENVHDLTFEELRQIECAKQLPDFPEAEVVPGNRIISLPEVFAIAAGHDVWFNIETKIEAEKPDICATPEQFVTAIFAAIDAAGVRNKVMIQSFDWRTFPLVHAIDPDIPLVALWDETTWHENSAWGPYNPDIISAAKDHNIAVLSPDYTLVDADLIQRAHDAGLRVVPWTVNDLADMQRLISLGGDGLITDYPKRLQQLLEG